MQLLVIYVFSNQFIVGTALHNLTIVQYADFIGMLYGTQSVSHRHGVTGFHKLLQGILNQALAFAIEV